MEVARLRRFWEAIANIVLRICSASLLSNVLGEVAVRALSVFLEMGSFETIEYFVF